MLLNNKFGVAIGICNQLSLGWGTREQRTLSWKIHTKMVYQKKNENNEKGQTMKNPSNFKFDCPNKLQMFSSTLTNCFKGEWRGWIHTLIFVGVPNSNFV